MSEVEISIDEVKRKTSHQLEKPLKNGRMPRKHVSFLEPSKEISSNLQTNLNTNELQTCSERKEAEICDDGNSNMPSAAPPPSRGDLGRGFSFIKGKSLKNLAIGMDDFEDSIDDITKELSQGGSSNSDPSSLKMWESGMTDEDDGMEEFRREMEMIESYQPEPVQELQIVSEEDKAEMHDDDNSNMPRAAPPPSRGDLGRGFSFIKGKSLKNLAIGMDDFENSIDDITEEFLNSDPSSSKMWESGVTFEDDGMEKLRREMEMTGSYQPDYIESRMEGDGTDVPHTPASSSKSSQLGNLCTQIRHRLELQELQERNDIFAKKLYETGVERDQLKNWQKEVMQVKEELGSNDTVVTFQKLAKDITDELYSKRKWWIFWLYGWIFLALLVVGTLPSVAFMLNSFKGRYNPIVFGHTKLPLKTVTSAERDTILNSKLQEALSWVH